MRIAFLISTLGAGGAERVCSLLCNQWADTGNDVQLLTFLDARAPLHYPLVPAVTLHRLDLLDLEAGAVGRVFNNLRRASVLHRLLRRLRPDVLVCFMTESNVAGIVASRGLGMLTIVSERVHPAHHRIGRVRAALRFVTYRFADRVVVQTADIARWSERHLRARTEVMANPVPLSTYREARVRASCDRSARPFIVAVGRLDRQKGFDLLIAAFAALAARHPQWDLVILGDGPERAALECERERLGLTGRVSLPGVVHDVAARLAEAELVVSASRYEGYPNAVVEALAAGCCVVASDAPGATRELLAGGEFGLLVPPEDAVALGGALDRVMGDTGLRQRLAERAPAAVAHLDLPDVAGRWLDLFERLR